MKYQLQIDSRPAGPIRDEWEDAARDAVATGYGTFVGDSVKLDSQASIARINKMAKAPPPPHREPPLPPSDIRPAGINAMPPCKIRQWGDMTGCVVEGCGLKWDTNDPEPPVCPRWGVARGKVAVPGYPSSGPSPYAYQAGSLWPLWASLIILAAAVAWVHGADIWKWLGL